MQKWVTGNHLHIHTFFHTHTHAHTHRCMLAYLAMYIAFVPAKLITSLALAPSPADGVRAPPASGCAAQPGSDHRVLHRGLAART